MPSPSWDAYPVPSDLPPVVINDPALPLVSIVTPSYNQGQFVRETIESVLTQDYPNIEYWVVDGSSTDGTISILKAYEHDPRFHWVSEKDRGQGDAVNKGWSRCRGEIVAWLNSDDTYCPDAVQAQAGYLLQNPDVDIVYGDYVFTNQCGVHVRNGYGRPFQFIELLRFTIPCQPTVFLTKKAILCGGPLDISFYYSVDSEYWLRLYKQGLRFAYNPRLVATYRLHASSKTVASRSKAHEDWRRLIRSYAPPEYYSEVLADLYLAIAIHLVGEGKIRQSLQHARHALSIARTRRMLLYAAVLADRIMGTSFHDYLLEYWTRAKRSV